MFDFNNFMKYLLLTTVFGGAAYYVYGMQGVTGHTEIGIGCGLAAFFFLLMLISSLFRRI